MCFPGSPYHYVLILHTISRFWGFKVKSQKLVKLKQLKKCSFFSRPFWIFFSKKFFCFIPMKISQIKDGTKFWWLLWFPAKNNPPQTFLPPVYNINVGNYCLHLKKEFLANEFSFSLCQTGTEPFLMSLIKMKYRIYFYVIS